ncbi:non-ribosomal peptide synthetase [Cellvibrio sp. OA-2007]|uniref:non-ribosomal peptide synthetase n=1 Tax=Cellvibrio sp. OA-2007 TaxID=529823 RepID=UPI000A06F89F|nr:non-ribosomal peptide synthetase [Cellvibrio sp. OA-2007]
MDTLKDGTVQVEAPLPHLEASYPLAPEQQGLWFLHRMAPDCGAYHLLFSFEAEINSAHRTHYQALLPALLRDYPILRTALPETAAGPCQQVFSSVAADIRMTDVIGMDDCQLRELARQDSRQPFNLAQPPLWRVHLYRRSANRWLVVAVAHHLLLDFWSLGLLLQDVCQRLGLPIPSSTQPDGQGYGVRAESLQVVPEARQAQWRDYWCEQLKGIPPAHGIPLDQPRQRLQSYEGRSLAFSLSRETSDQLKALTRARGVTPFMTFLATWAISLHSLCGDEDWVISSPVAGRLARAERQQLGQFVNTLALRVGVDGKQTFAEVLQQVRERVIGAIKHQDCPFPWLVEQLAPERDPGLAPLSQIGFSWERLPLLADFEGFFLPEPPAQVLRFDEVMLSPFAVPQQEGQLELQLEMGGERDGAYTGQLKYVTGLFTPASAQRVRDNFMRWVKTLVANPETPINQLQTLSEEQQQLLLQLGRGPERLWYPPHAQFGMDEILGDIAERVKTTPDALAVMDGQQRYSYQQLWARAHSIAGALAAQGVAPQTHVGLFLHRHCDLLASILGVWLCGAAYVPLDPNFPAERLAYIAEDAQLHLLLTESALLNDLPLPMACLVVDQPLAANAGFQPVHGQAAYILYTSGSTGKPKGVRVGHASLRNFLLSMQELLGWDAQHRLLAITTTAFDISLLELFLPMLGGGSLMIADNSTSHDGQALARCLNDHGINCLQATPASWKMLLDAGWQAAPGFTALCGGEALTPDLASRLHAQVEHLWNVYGPTETTVWSTASRLEPGTNIHLGQPLANTQLYVLDAEGQLAAPGAFGELWIGGTGLALDYWRRPELTQEKFTYLPQLRSAGRLYRTGDKVRWNSLNQLEHHGRLDFQVKLRGYRIELGEIEQLIKQSAGVKDALVIVREDRPGDTRLVAYLIADEALDQAVISAQLAEKLPAYMLPSAWVKLAAFPETPNRKVDRKALPKPSYDDTGRTYRAPADALQMQLAGLFGELLDMSNVGADDDFFALGGHSLLAVQLLSAIRRLTGADLALADLLQHKTVASLAARIRNHSDQTGGMNITLRAGVDTQPLWLFHPIGGNVFCYLELVRQLNPARPVIAFQAPGLDDMDAAEVSIENMASLYLEQLRQLQPEGPYLLGGWCFGGTLAFEVARQLQRSGEWVDGVVLIDTRAPIEANVPADSDDATLLSWFARDLATPYGKSLRIAPETLRELAPEHMFSHVLDEAKAIGVLPLDADVAALERYFQVYIGNGIALRLYFPEPEPLPLLLLRALDEQEDYGPSLGWSELAAAGLTQIDLAGDHNSIMYAPQAQAVASAIDNHFSLKPHKGFAA